MIPVSFMYPAVLVLLVLVPAIGITGVLARRSRSQNWKKLVAPRLRRKLATTTGSWRFWTSLGTSLLGLALIIFATARPHRGFAEEEAVTKGRNILLIMDTSRSMRTRDLSPSRLDVARTIAFECLSVLPNDRVGIMAFANQPYILAPLTIDHGILQETIEQLNHDTVPEGGSDLAAAIQSAVRTLKETGQTGNAIIVMSDGEDHESGILEAAEEAQAAGIRILTIGLGTAEGDVIPDPASPNNIFKDNTGKVIVSRLEDQGMRTLARETGGLYIPAKNMTNVAQLVTSTLEGLDRVALESQTQRRPNDVFQWFLVPGLISLIISLLLRTRFRSNLPPALTSILVCSTLFLATPQLRAETSKAENADKLTALIEAANKPPSPLRRLGNFLRGVPKKKDLAPLYYRRGLIKLANGDFSSAREDLASALLSEDPKLQAESTVAYGNSWAKEGKAELLKELEVQKTAFDAAKLRARLESSIESYKDALDHYGNALELDPKSQSAPANKQRVEEGLNKMERLLKLLEEEEEEQDPSEDQEQQQEQDQEQQDSGDEGDQQQEQSPGEESEEENQQPGDEQEDSSEESDQEGDQQQPSPGDEEGDETEDLAGEQSEAGDEPGEETEQPRSAQQGSPLPAPRADETDEEFALRILEENADFDIAPPRKATKPEPRGKNW